MLKRFVIICQLQVFIVFSKVQSAESQGMPQLNPEFWFSQIFWLIITFGLLFLTLSKIILPKIRDNLETRKIQILENIETAEKHRTEIENKTKEYEKIILNSKNTAKNYLNDAKKKLTDQINTKRQNLELNINEEIKLAEKEILELKKNSPEKIKKIAADTSADIIKLLIGADVNNSSILATVEDLSKKNEDKYYGV